MNIEYGWNNDRNVARILIIEDERRFAVSCERRLKSEDMILVEARTGESGPEVCDQSAARSYYS